LAFYEACINMFVLTLYFYCQHSTFWYLMFIVAPLVLLTEQYMVASYCLGNNYHTIQ